MKVGEYIGNASSFVEGTHVQGLVTPNHNVGVEVEIENFIYDFDSDQPDTPRLSHFFEVDNHSELPPIKKHWLIVKDNSLRKGVEFIFAGPKKGKEIVKAIEELGNFFGKYSRNGLPPQASDRCSVHVHMDVRDMDEESLNRLMSLYVLVERILFEYVDPSRSKNNYCRPVTDSQFMDILAEISRRANPSEFSGAISYIKNACDKYSALNLLPIHSFGTVEFRHHQGTANANDILDWINILLALKVAANIHPDLIIHIYEVEGYQSLIKTIFDGTVLCDEFLERPNLKYLVRKGMNDYRELLNVSALQEMTYTKPKAMLSMDLLKLVRKQFGIAPSPKPVAPKPALSSAMFAGIMADQTSSADTVSIDEDSWSSPTSLGA